MKKRILLILARLGYRDLESVLELCGGSVHHVYKFKDATAGNLIAKWRLPKTKELLDFEVESHEITREAEGLKFFSNKDVIIPSIKSLDAISGVLVMTPIIENGCNLKSWIDQNGMPEEDIFFRILDDIEKLLIKGKGSRGLGVVYDDSKFVELVAQRFKYQEGDAVKKLTTNLISDTQNRCFIHGGLSFKNILYNGREYGFCDFETFCYGHPVFDIGYYLGHVLFYYMISHKISVELFKRIDRFVTNSKLLFKDHEDNLVKTIVFTLLYRLTHPLFGYKYGARDQKESLVHILNFFAHSKHLTLEKLSGVCMDSICKPHD